MPRPLARPLAGLLLLLAAGAGAKDRPAASERVVPVGGIVDVAVSGTPARLRVDPGAPGLPLVDAALARRAGLKQGRFAFGFLYAIGPDRFSYATAVDTLDFAAVPSKTTRIKRRMGWPWRPTGLAPDAPWTPHSYAGVADGTISPISMPDPVVRLRLREPRAGERTVAVPMVDGGGLFGRFTGLYGLVQVGGAPMRVRFDPYRPRTLANVGAGLRLAAAHGGRLSGPVEPAPIAFGVARPARTMTLARPLAIGPLTLRTLGVRVADAGFAAIPEPDGPTAPPAAAVRDADAAVPASDPDEVVVVAKGKRDARNDRLSIGADLLQACSSIVVDKPAKQIRLTCGA